VVGGAGALAASEGLRQKVFGKSSQSQDGATRDATHVQ
jgi:hypothetical protein